MLFTSPVYSQVSGSIAGITYSHGRSGMVTKARRKPTNPNSELQRIVRGAMRTLAPEWGQVLTEAERAAWNLYAANVPMTNRLGQTIYLTGHQHFIRSSIPRLVSDAPIPSGIPTTYNLGSFTTPTIISAVEATQAVTIAFTKADDWAAEIGAHLLFYVGRPVGPGRKFFRKPWRYGGRANGIPGGAFPPLGFFSPWPLHAGNQLWVLCRVSRSDGRLSSPIILGPETIVP